MIDEPHVAFHVVACRAGFLPPLYQWQAGRRFLCLIVALVTFREYMLCNDSHHSIVCAITSLRQFVLLLFLQHTCILASMEYHVDACRLRLTATLNLSFLLESVANVTSP